jgi:hypothetical protein
MKLLSFCHENDYGDDFYVIVLRLKKRSLFQFAFGTGVYGFTPRFSVSMDAGAFLSVSAAFWKVYFTVELFGFNWRG